MNAKRLFAGTPGSILFALGMACGEPPTAAPVAESPTTPVTITTLDAISPTYITGVVGSLVTERPSVVVRDQNGAPMAGVQVLFTLVVGGSSLTQGSVETDALGQATLTEWVLSRTPGHMIVAATAGHLMVEFHATIEPGPPVILAKYAGDNQLAPPGIRVPIRPQVRVTDAYNNVLAGVTVVFAVAAGGGSLTDESAKTDALGIATLGSWTLGTNGAQSLMATTASLDPIIFEATAVYPPKSCAPPVELLQGRVVKSELTGQQCFERYTIVLSKADTYEFKLSSAGFDGRLELRDLAENEIAASEFRVSASSSVIRAVLPRGVFTLVVSSVRPDAAGQFDVSYTPSVSNRGGCDEAFMVRGVEFERNVSSGNCTPIELMSWDRFRIRMTAGSRVMVRLDDYSLSVNGFEMEDDYGRIVATGVSKNYVESDLEFTAFADGYYVIRVQVAERYMLTVW